MHTEQATAFYRAADNVAVFDAHAGNLIKTPWGLVPIDVVALYLDDWRWSCWNMDWKAHRFR